jgi:hypothetical protein
VRNQQVLAHLIRGLSDAAPKFYPVTIGIGRSVMPCCALIAAIRGAEPSVERSAADRRVAWKRQRAWRAMHDGQP